MHTIDQERPHEALLPSIGEPYSNQTLTEHHRNTLPTLRSLSVNDYQAEAANKLKENPIFQARMAHPSGTMLGERMQK